MRHMTRKDFLRRAAFATAALLTGTQALAARVAKLVKSREEWRKLLPRDAYQVLFEEDTERAGSSPLNAEKRKGTYVCAACFLPLFDSSTKYESGTGWPSFYRPLDGAVGTSTDRSWFMVRTEVHCSRCGGHLGHVFPDGPPPTGQRYCMNGVAMKFEPKK